MLEFLRECDENNIYSYAMDVEINLKSFNAVLMMNVFFEKNFKSILVNELGVKANDVERKKLTELIQDENLKSFLIKKLKFYEIEKVGGIIRKLGNNGKHSLNYERPNDEEIQKLFEIVFIYSKDYYSYKTGKPGPQWSNDLYNELYSNCVTCIDKSEKEKLEEEYNNLLDEVAKKDKDVKKYKKKIFELEQTIVDKDNSLASNNSKMEQYTSKIAKLEIEKERLQMSKNELETKIYVSKKETDKQFEKFDNMQSRLDRLLEMKHAIEEQDFPKCPLCNSSLVIRTNKSDGNKFWSCPNWESNGIGCQFKARNVTPNETNLLKINGAIENEISSIKNELFEMDVENSTKEIIFNYFDTTTDYINPTYYFFNTILTTKSIIEAKDNNILNYYSKFYFVTNNVSKIVNDKEKLIYSLALRI